MLLCRSDAISAFCVKLANPTLLPVKLKINLQGIVLYYVRYGMEAVSEACSKSIRDFEDRNITMMNSNGITCCRAEDEG